MLKQVLSHRCGPLTGTLTVPGDVDVALAGLFLGALAQGATSIRSAPRMPEVSEAITALRSLGAKIIEDGDVLYCDGVAQNALIEPSNVLFLGKSAKVAQGLIGLLATQPFTSFVAGSGAEFSLTRLMKPLEQMGAQFIARHGDLLPLAIVGAPKPTPIVYRAPDFNSLKEPLLLAALNAEGVTTIIERAPTPDGLESLLRQFGAQVSAEETVDGATATSIIGKPQLAGQNIVVSGALDLAIFPLVAALLRPGSAVTIRAVGINAYNAVVLNILQEMGANIVLSNRQENGGALIADLMVQGCALHGITIPQAWPLLDHYPILAVAASCALGVTRFTGVSEKKLNARAAAAAVVKGLRDVGTELGFDGGDLVISSDGLPSRGSAQTAPLEARAALSMLVLGLLTEEGVTLTDSAPVFAAYPQFVSVMNKLGADLLADD